MTTETWLPALFGYLIPIGFLLLNWGGQDPKRARQAAVTGLTALSLAAVGYFATGFAFHLGGAGVSSQHPDLVGLDRLIGHRVEAGLYWGVIGLEGFFLTGGADTPQALLLFFTYLPLVATATLLPMLSLQGRVRSWQRVLVGFLIAILVFPLAACWVWGGGWLAALGRTIQRGHGLIDYAGSGVVYLLSGALALGGLLAVGRKGEPRAPDQMPPAHFPLLANLGALLIAVGWLGWSLGAPFHVGSAEIGVGRVMVNGLLALGGSTLVCSAYCWLTLGHADPLMVARGATTGMVSIAAAAPFVPPWSALVIGAVAGLLLPFGVYIVDRVRSLSDATDLVPPILGGAWGLLTVGLFADGRWGQGWNGVGIEEYRTVAGQGVTGLLSAPGFVGDGPGQSIAQLAGLGTLILLGLLGGWLLLKALGAVTPSRS